MAPLTYAARFLRALRLHGRLLSIVRPDAYCFSVGSVFTQTTTRTPPSRSPSQASSAQRQHRFRNAKFDLLALDPSPFASHSHCVGEITPGTVSARKVIHLSAECTARLIWVVTGGPGVKSGKHRLQQQLICSVPLSHAAGLLFEPWWCHRLSHRQPIRCASSR